MNDLSKWFSEKELTCRCGCGYCVSDPVFLSQLDLLRDTIGEPIVITSGARCEAHNAAVGGKPDSAHTTGLAVDIAASSSHLKFIIVSKALECGFKRIGFHKDFIHIDIDDSKLQEVMWPY